MQCDNIINKNNTSSYYIHVDTRFNEARESLKKRHNLEGYKTKYA